MNKTLFIFIAIFFVGLLCAPGCKQEKPQKDRSEAKEMFERICKLTKEYADKLADSPDSSSWAANCNEFEDKLDKVNFSYPPDTDLLLTEGQNDTIHSLMMEYVKVRDERIHAILHPIVELDSLMNLDSVGLIETASEAN